MGLLLIQSIVIVTFLNYYVLPMRASHSSLEETLKKARIVQGDELVKKPKLDGDVATIEPNVKVNLKRVRRWDDYYGYGPYGGFGGDYYGYGPYGGGRYGGYGRGFGRYGGYGGGFGPPPPPGPPPPGPPPPGPPPAYGGGGIYPY